MYNILSFRLVFYPPYVPYHNTCLNLFAFTCPPVLYGQDCTYLANCYISLASGPPTPHKSSLNWTEPQKLRAKTTQASFNMTACTSRTSSPAITPPSQLNNQKFWSKRNPLLCRVLSVLAGGGGGSHLGHMLGYISLDGWGEVLSQWLRFPNTSSKSGVWLVTRRGGESTFLFGSAKDTA